MSLKEAFKAMEVGELSAVKNLVAVLPKVELEMHFGILLNKGADIEAKNSHGYTPLTISAYFVRVEVLTLLCRSGANLEAHDNDGNTPLIKAADCGHAEVIALLCQRGARLDAKNNVSIKTSTPTVYLYTVASDDSVRNQYGCSAVHSAALKGHLKAVMTLVENGVTIDSRNECQGTPLFISAYYGHPEVVTYLCEKGANMEAYTVVS
eukprot:gene23713-30753_t